jgi:hypothetical protein
MEIANLLQLIWRRRVALASGYVVALALAVVVGKSPVAPSGVAKTRVVFDTHASQLVTGDPDGANTLPWRATVGAMLLGSDASREMIANELRIPQNQLAVTDLELTASPIPASLPRAAVTAANGTSAPYALTVTTDDWLPVVGIYAAAPSRDDAQRLAEAAVRALQAGAAPRDTEELQGLRISAVGTIQARAIPGGPGRKMMAVMFVGLAGLWTVLALTGPLLSGIARTVRRTSVALPEPEVRPLGGR